MIEPRQVNAIVNNFVRITEGNTQDIAPTMQEIINEYYWDMLEDNNDEKTED